MSIPVAAHFLGLRVRISLLLWKSVSCDVLCSQVEVSAAGLSLAQKSPTEWGVSECDRHIKVLVQIAHNNTLYTRTY